MAMMILENKIQIVMNQLKQEKTMSIQNLCLNMKLTTIYKRKYNKKIT